MRRNILHSACSPKPQATQVETQNFASHKRVFRKRIVNNMPLIMIFLASHKQPCRKRMVNNMPLIMIFLASHKQPCRKSTLNYIPHISMLLPTRETQDFASLQGSRHQYKILLTLLMRYCMPYPYIPSSLAIRTFWLSAKALFCLYIVFFLHISDDNQIVTQFFPRPVYSL